MNLSAEVLKIISDYDINIFESHNRKFSNVIEKVIISDLNILMFPHDMTMIIYSCQKCNKQFTCIVWKYVWMDDYCRTCYFTYHNSKHKS